MADNVFLQSSCWSTGGIKSEATAEISKDGMVMSKVEPISDGGDSGSSQASIVASSNSPKAIKARIVSNKMIFARATVLLNGRREVIATEEADAKFKNTKLRFLRKSESISTGVESAESFAEVSQDCVSSRVNPYIGNLLSPLATVSQTGTNHSMKASIKSQKKLITTATLYGDGTGHVLAKEIDDDKENQGYTRRTPMMKKSPSNILKQNNQDVLVRNSKYNSKEGCLDQEIMPRV